MEGFASIVHTMSDENKVFPEHRPEIDRSPEWAKERSRMRSTIVLRKMSEMTEEDLSQIARSTINSRYQYMPDDELIKQYYDAGGSSSEAITAWTIKYR